MRATSLRGSMVVREVVGYTTVNDCLVAPGPHLLLEVIVEDQLTTEVFREQWFAQHLYITDYSRVAPRSASAHVGVAHPTLTRAQAGAGREAAPVTNLTHNQES